MKRLTEDVGKTPCKVRLTLRSRVEAQNLELGYRGLGAPCSALTFSRLDTSTGDAHQRNVHLEDGPRYQVHVQSVSAYQAFELRGLDSLRLGASPFSYSQREDQVESRPLRVRRKW